MYDSIQSAEGKTRIVLINSVENSEKKKGEIVEAEDEIEVILKNFVYFNIS